MQRRMRCPTCGRTLRLATLPFIGARWVHGPGERVMHDRVVYAKALEAERLAKRQPKPPTCT